MRVEWHGQSAFTLASDEATVFIDPFGDMGALLADRSLKFDYPPIEANGVDLLFLPVGGGPTIGGAQAAAIVSRLDARWVVPMHYRTTRADFLPETEEGSSPRCRRPPASSSPPSTPPTCPPGAARSPWSPSRPSVYVRILNQRPCGAMVPLPGLTRAQPKAKGVGFEQR